MKRESTSDLLTLTAFRADRERLHRAREAIRDALAERYITWPRVIRELLAVYEARIDAPRRKC